MTILKAAIDEAENTALYWAGFGNVRAREATAPILAALPAVRAGTREGYEAFANVCESAAVGLVNLGVRNEGRALLRVVSFCHVAAEVLR